MAFHFILLSVIAAFFVQSVVFRRFGLSKVRYRRTISSTSCYQGDEIEMVERIENRKWLPVPWLRVESQLSSGLGFHSQSNFDVSSGQIYQNHKSFFSLMPLTKITRRHAITCMKRGVYRFESVTLSAGDLFGVSSISKRLTFEEKLIVYPKPLSYDELQLPSHSWQGDVTVRRWIVEDPFMIAGTREYRYGDPLKGVNWKATARTGKLQVHQYDHTADHRLMIVLNMEDHEEMWNVITDIELIERGIATAAGIAQYAVSQGIETGFMANTGTIEDELSPIMIEPGGGAPHLTYVYETMAKMVIARLMPLHELLQRLAQELEMKTDIVVLTAYESDKLMEAADMLRREGHSVSMLRLEPELTYDTASKAGESA